MSEDSRHDSWRRLVDMIGVLRKKPSHASELAERFGVAESTVRRDLSWMEKNVPGVSAKQMGRRKIYEYEPESERLQIHYPAAFCLLTGARAISVLEESDTWEGFSEVLAFAKKTFGSQVDRKICVLRSNFHLSKEQQQFFDILVQALRDERVIGLRYHAPEREPYDEECEPLSLMGWRGRLYLIVRRWKAGKAELRLRRLDRIQNIELLVPKRRFSYPSIEDFDPDQLFRYSVGPFFQPNPPTSPVILRFFDDEAERHRDFDWGVEHRVLRNEPLEIELNVHIDYSLRHFVLRAGGGVEVLAPQHFREEIAQELERAQKRYSPK